MYWDCIVKKGCLVFISLVLFNEFLGVFLLGSDVF